jgi:hypothetical protein
MAMGTAVITSGMTMASTGPASPVVIDNGHVRVKVEQVGGRWSETYFAKVGRAWKQLLVSGSKGRPDPAFYSASTLSSAGYAECEVRTEEEIRPTLLLRCRAGTVTIEKRITLPAGKDYAHVLVTLSSPASIRLGYLLSTYRFVPDGKSYTDYGSLDFVFTPQLRPEKDDVIGDHVFRSPALMLQVGKRFAALVPDLQTIDGNSRGCRAGADLQVDTLDAPLVSFGFLPWAKRAHVYYSHPDTLSTVVPAGSYTYGFYLFVKADAQPRLGYREVVHHAWETYGRPNLAKAIGPQAEPFARYINRAWDEYLPQVALDAEYQGKPVTLLRQYRLAWSNKLPKAADNDSWFNVWFNALRTAYGMYLHGDVTGDSVLKDRAERVLNLALHAPQKEGIAPSIFYLDSSGGHWVNDQAWGGIREGRCYAMFHNAWTCYWLLQWSDLLPARREEILHFTTAFKNFLVAQQRASGVIPSWYDPETVQPVEELRDDNAETAGAALFLAEFSRRTNDRSARRAAEGAMAYVFREVLPHHKWFDYETFFSCSRKPLGFYDHYTLQHPQNTLSIHQASEACLALYRLTGKAIYKEKGCEILDYLSLYQQVWSPRWLSCELLGGFGVQNTDAEWSDSRQGYFAVTYMKYYDLTGRREYFERGVAALRAMFSLFESSKSPRTAENYAHSSTDQLAGVTGLHWGTGSSVVSIHILAQQYGGAFVNVREQWGVGIDGCRIPAVSVTGKTIAVEILDNVSSPRPIKLVFGAVRKGTYVVQINGKRVGSYASTKLEKGIDITL